MIQENNTKIEPLYKGVASDIARRVSHAGYGFMIPHATMNEMLDLHAPDSVYRYKQYLIDRMVATEGLKKQLLDEHNIYLMVDHGKGYTVLHPNDQVEIAPRKHMRKAQIEMTRAVKSLTNVNVSHLSHESDGLRLRNLSKIAFIANTVKGNKLQLLKDK